MIVTVEFYSKQKDKQITPHFAVHEFVCKCGECNTAKYEPDGLVKMMEDLFFNKCKNVKSVLIPSPYRDPLYSVKVKGGKDDAHVRGFAADIKVKKSAFTYFKPSYIACIAEDYGFTGIGVMKDSVHLDTRDKKKYVNDVWRGDETRKEADGTTDYSLSKRGISFWTYYNLTREQVYKEFGAEIPEKYRPKPTYFKKYTGKSISIVDALKSIGVDSSLSYRKKIAAKNNISGYIGTSKQNGTMLDLLKKGKLIKP